VDRRQPARRERCPGEIACVDDSGRSVFNDLLFRRRECVFFAFDLLFLNGEALRGLSVIDRKVRLKRLLRRKRSPIERPRSLPRSGSRSRNPRYSQAEGRNELFNPQPDGITKV
jgi:ATP-dependent DNA ligase